MTHTAENKELVKMLTDARRSERLQLLELLESKLERLAADKTTHDQVISSLKYWINVRRSTEAHTTRRGNDSIVYRRNN